MKNQLKALVVLIAGVLGLGLFQSCDNTNPPVVPAKPGVTVIPSYTPCGWPGNTCTPTLTLTPTATNTPTPTATPTATPTCVAPSGTIAAPVTYNGVITGACIVANRVFLGAPARLTDIKMSDCNSGVTTSLTAGIYTDYYNFYNYAPYQLLGAVTAMGSTLCDGSLNLTFTFSTPITLTGGNYWLAVGSDYQFGYWYSQTLSGAVVAGSYGTFPATFPNYSSAYTYPNTSGPILAADWVCP